MRPSVRRALRTVAARLSAHEVPFALGGSGLLWALGLASEVRDVDLMLEPADERRMLDATADWRVRHTREGTELWASDWFSQLEVDGVAVDAIGGMAFRHTAGVARLPLRAAGTIDVDGVSVPYADPALWWAVYRVYKPDRARLLERVLDPDETAAVAAELGLPGPDRPHGSHAESR